MSTSRIDARFAKETQALRSRITSADWDRASPGTRARLGPRPPDLAIEKAADATNVERLRIDIKDAIDIPESIDCVNDALPIEFGVFEATNKLTFVDRRTLPWSEVRELLSAPKLWATKKSRPLLSFSRFGNVATADAGALRHDGNVEMCFAIVGDYDDAEIPIAEAVARLKAAGVEAFVVTSASHMLDKDGKAGPRYHIIAPLFTPCTPDAHPANVALLNGALGGLLAGESWILSQSFFFGRVQGVEFEAHHVEGACLDTLDLVIDPIGKTVSEKAGPVGDLPELLTELAAIDASLLTPGSRSLWSEGVVEGDTSKALHALSVELCKIVPDDIAVISHMVANPHVLAVAQAKAKKTRRDPIDFMWRYSMKGARGKANESISDGATFDVIAKDPAALPSFKRDKAGKIEAELPNILKGIEAAHMSGWELRFDTFLNKPMISRATTGEWRPFEDADAVAIRLSLQQRGFKPIGREMMRDCLNLFAALHRFDSAIDWIQSLTWDGEPRVEKFLTRYFGVADSPYPKAVSLYWLTAQAGRVIEPGAKADMIPVLIGPQGSRKTTALQTLAANSDQYVEINLADIGKPDLARSMRGCLIGEVAELRGLQTKELESIKAWVTITHDTWIEKFKEHPVKVARRLVLVGTTNEDEFLADATGNRRWLPVRVGAIDTAAIARDREQLWAEARDLYLTQGIIYAQAEGLAPSIHDQHRITDSWSEAIEEWLGQRQDGPFTLRDVMMGALQLNPSQMTKAVDMRVGGMLRTLGFKRGKNTINKKQVWSWSK